MSAICEPAARFQDPIEHSSALAGLVAGLVVGAVVGAAIVFSGGAALGPILVAACTGASLGGTIGEFAGSFITSEAGHVCSGAESVLIGGQKAARAIADTVDCDAGQHIAQGSETVFIERFPAARKSDKTTCGGTIANGFPSVIVGSGRTDYLDVGDEVPLWLEIGVMVLGLVGMIGEIGLALRAKSAKTIASNSSKVSRSVQFEINKAAGRAAEKVAAEKLIANGNTILGSQVSVRTSAGLRRIDYLIQTPTGRILAVEVKAGKAVRSLAQLEKDAALASEGGVLVGKNAPAGLQGKQLVIDTIEMVIP